MIRLRIGSQGIIKLHIGIDQTPIHLRLVSMGSGGGAVSSVNGKIGSVVLNATDVGADALGSADAAQSAAESYTDNAVSNIDFPVDSVNGKTGIVVINKSDVGLPNVDNTSDTNKPISTATQTALSSKASTSYVDSQNALNEKLTNKNQTNGYAGLDGTGKVAAAQLPSYVDDVLEFANLAAFPSTGSSGIIYVADDTAKIYRWSGSTYIEISPSPGSTDSVPEGSINKYYTDARAAAAAPVQSVAGKTGAISLVKSDVGLSNVDNTSDINKPISTATQVALDTKVVIANDLIGTPAAPVTPYAYQPTTQPRPNTADTIITNFQSGHGYTKISAAGTYTTNDTTTFVRGSQSTKLLTDGIGSAVFIRKTSISPVIDITNKQIKVIVMVDKPTNVTELFFYFSSDGVVSNWVTIKPSDDITAIKPNVWTTLTFSYAGRNGSTTGTPTLSAINSIQVRIKDDATTAVTLNVQEIAIYDAPSAGIVSITFDDGYASQYLLAKPKMDQYEYAGTAYIIPARVGVTGTPTYMTLAQLHTLDELGWDIANHTYDHPYLTTDPSTFVTLTPAQVEAEFYQSKKYFVDNGFTKAIHDLALPHGAYDDAVVLPIAKKYFRSVRTIVNQAETITPANRYKLRVLYVLNTTTTATVQTAIDRALAGGEWLIMVFHDIQATTASQDIQYTQANFNTIIDYLATSNAKVKPLTDVLNTVTDLPIPESQVKNLVTDLAAKEPVIATGTTLQYIRGDKSLATLNQDVVPDGTTNKAYTAADKTRLANTSGTNTGDQTIPTSLPPNGAAGGDLSGNYPNPTVTFSNDTIHLLKSNNLSDLLNAATARTNLGLGSLAVLSTVSIANINATGTPSSSTYLRGDGTWSTPTTTATPAGSDTQVQFNNAGSFGASSKLTWNNTNNALFVGVPGTAANGILSSATMPLSVIDAVANGYSVGVQQSSTSGGTTVAILGSQGTPVTPTATQSSDLIGGYTARGYGATQWASGSRSGIYCYATQNWTDTAQGTNVAIAATANGTAARLNVAFFTGIASAVNLMTFTNSATGTAPTITVSGTDTNIDGNFVTKGTGRFKVNSVIVPTISSNDAFTNKDMTGSGNTFPTFNQNTSGSAATLSTPRTIATTGDVSYTSPGFDGSANVTNTATLATVNSNVGSYSNANITVNAKGLITAASNGTGGSGSSSSVTDSINQTSHGFTVGQSVRFNGTIYVTAKSDAAANAEGVGIVSSVANANSFTITTHGYIIGWSHGLSLGVAAFLSASTAGALTNTEPSTIGQVSKPMFVPDTTTSGYVINYRGIVISSITNPRFNYGLTQAIASGVVIF